MKAAVVERPGVLAVREVPDPVVGDYDARCALEYGATCTGTDTHLIKGTFPWPITYPAILGHESVGRVTSMGSKVRHFRIGDLVTRVGAPAAGDVGACWGGFAEWGIAKDHWAMAADGLPAAAWTGFRVNQVVPPGVDARAAPMFTTWRETLSYLLRIGVGTASRVLVIGTGGNALSFVRHAVLLGAAAVWVVGSPRLEATVRRLGAHGFVDYHRADAPTAFAASLPDGFDVIVDAVGKAGQADRFLPCLSPGGRIGIYGIDDLATVRLSPWTARGPFTVWPASYDESETHQRVSELVLQGMLEPSAWYPPERTYPLPRIAEAFADLWQRKAVKALIALRS